MFCDVPKKKSKKILKFLGFYAPAKTATVFAILVIFAKTAIFKKFGCFGKKVSQMTNKQARDPNLVPKLPQSNDTLNPTLNIQANYKK